MEHRGLQVVDVDRVFNRVVAQFVRLAVQANDVGRIIVRVLSSQQVISPLMAKSGRD